MDGFRPTREMERVGIYKTWTLDSGLDSGLDYGLDYRLDYGLDYFVQ